MRRKDSLAVLGGPPSSRLVSVLLHLADDTGVHALDQRLHLWPAVAPHAREDNLVRVGLRVGLRAWARARVRLGLGA